MKTYKHLNKEERRILARLLKQHESIRTIAKIIGRSHTTISREINRNLTSRYYHPLHAEFVARVRQWECHRRERLKTKALKRKIESWLRQKWSPEIIAGRFKREQGKHVISHEAIYQWLYMEAPHLVRFLPRHHPQRRWYHIDRSKCLIMGRIHVSKRTQQANLRKELGHWEADLLEGGKGQSALKVTVERKTRFTKLAKVPNKSALASYRALKHIFSSVPSSLLRSVTYDNGLENSLHRQINSLFNIQSFFCSPGHSWEKPSVENTNGIIRWFLPKSTNLDTISDHQILRIERWLNSRPRKCLNFLTSAEALKIASGALTG